MNYLHERAYYYNETTDAYVFNLAGVAKPVVLPGTVVRDMVRGYSNLGEGGSLQEVARAASLPRGWVVQIMRALEVTHDGLPFTQEELKGREIADLEAEGLAVKGANLYRSLERASWTRVQEEAKQWRELETSILRRFPTGVGRPVEPLRLVQGKADRRFGVVLSPTDFHWGKWGAVEEGTKEYNRRVARERLRESTAKCLAGVLCHGQPERIFVGVGSDYFHVDNEAGTTSGGTPQDRDGNPLDIIETGCEMMIEYVDMLRAVAPVDLVLMAGNHDHLLGYCLLLYLSAYYRGVEGVRVRRTADPRQYVEYGSTLLTFVHGDAVHKTGDIARLAAVEAREQWGRTEHRVALTGHLHYEKMEDDRGFVRYQMPSLSGTDRWHTRHGYVGSRVLLSAVLIDHEAGVFGTLLGGESKGGESRLSSESKGTTASSAAFVSADGKRWTASEIVDAGLDLHSIRRVCRGARRTYNGMGWSRG
jgi:hypothetical protein